ncbi:MAG: OmpA family protein [Verrucomicrobiota bacterium]|nr:OmpA family protein [Verrucomicrobiota bacterium]
MNETVAILRGENNAPFRKWFIIGLIISILLHIIVLYLARYVFFTSEESRKQPVDMKKYSQTRVNVDPKFFRAQVVSDVPSPATMEPPKVTIEQAAMALDEKRTLQRLVENTKPVAAAPPQYQDAPAAVGQAQIVLPEGKSDLKQLPPSAVFQEVDLIHQNSLGKMPTSTQAMPQPNADVAQKGQTGNGTSEDGVPGFQKLAELLNKKPEEVVDAVKQGQAISLGEKIIFDYNKSSIKQGAKPVLDELIVMINTQFPKAVIQIDGYTDSTGSAEYNLTLSQARAEAVKDWLVKFGGLSDRRFTVKGNGATNFVVSPNGSIDQQAPNRRTEIRIVSH